MIKSTIKSAVHAARRVYFNRGVKGNPTLYGKLWQRAANDALRAEMCAYFGVDEEWELPQTVIDNYSSRSHKLNATFVASQLQTLIGDLRTTKSVLKVDSKIKESEDDWSCEQVGYLPLTVNGIKTTIGFTSTNIQSFEPLFYVNSPFGWHKNPKAITLPDIDVQDKVDLELGSSEYYSMLMHQLKPFVYVLYMTYLQRTSLVLCSPIASGPVNILLDPSFVSKITGVETNTMGCYIGIKMSLTGHLEYVGHVLMSTDLNPELKQIFNQNAFDDAMSKIA